MTLQRRSRGAIPGGPTRAFPNAYLEVDELPRRVIQRLAGLAAFLGTAEFGLTILILSLVDPDYSPVSQAASDYGVGRFAAEMNLGFLIGGVGLISYAYLLHSLRGSRRTSKAGVVLYLIAGLVLVMDSYFTTSVEGAPPTVHALIHGFGGLIFFITAPLGTILVSSKFGRGRVAVVGVGFLIGFVLLVANVNAGGLAERVILLVIFSSVIYTAAKSGAFKD